LFNFVRHGSAVMGRASTLRGESVRVTKQNEKLEGEVHLSHGALTWREKGAAAGREIRELN